ncbi:MAG: DEAD/DEAH box helicase family protein [Candidatus Gracilibacteria bacterium]|nr:DEAD/DEAH box helicase family protein [Candidatus Gracilibacteria bacterium]
MKLQFDANQSYQLQAIDSIVNIFEGNSKIIPGFRLSRRDDINVVKNVIDIYEEEILQNMQKIQTENNLDITKDIKNFSIEMETGTGKTYVYLRTIFELNKKYGMTKFIIIVPSVAIRAGVLKSLDITREHFKELYPETHINYFEYDSSKISKISHFCEGTELQVMIITSSAFVGDNKIINQTKRDDVGEKSLMEQIASTYPVLILDEPQSIEGQKTKLKLKDFNPLFSLRYSATHKEDFSMMYKLTPWDAYKSGLVKQVGVIGINESSDSNLPNIELIKIENNARGKLECSLKLVVFDKENNSLFKNIKFKVDYMKHKDDNLFEKTKNPIYKGIIVENMTREEVIFNKGIRLKIGEKTTGDNKDLIKLQIDKTIESHFKKKDALVKLGIKPLTLFFIDHVASFIKLGGELDGWIQDYFIEKLKNYYNDDENIKDYFKYYFASKKNKKTNVEIFKDNLGNSQDDRKIEKESYDLIMKEKEKLLSFSEKTEFIFSHSALKEGWDNPNVFTICTLKNTSSEIRKRQEIGRGMRLAVKQDGTRELNKEINKLTVVVNESYENFVKNYQKDLEINYGYSSIEAKNASEEIENIEKTKNVELLEDNFKTESFKNFWSKINKKTYYDIIFDENELVKKSIEEINNNLEEYNISRQIVTTTIVDMVYNDNSKTFEGQETGENDYKIVNNSYTFDSIINLFQEEVKLSKKVIYQIFSGLGKDKKELILKNPIKFVKEVSKYISLVKQRLETEKVNYYLSDETYEIEQVFVDKNITIDESSEKVVTCLGNNGNIKSLYEKLRIDSDVERDFVNHFIQDSNIQFFFKIPSKKFQIKTPMGNYSPDWGLVIKSGDIDEIHFIVENKGTTQWLQLKEIEQNKIKCTKKHFKKLESSIKYDYYNNYENFKSSYIELVS